MAATSPSDENPLRIELRRHLASLVPPAERLVVAVSGGPDSTALLHALATSPMSGTELVAVHVNHHLRADASERDAEFVRKLSGALGIPVVVLDGALPDDAVRSRGIEAAARSVRYRLLSLERDRIGANYIATAHTRSDQAETVLLRLMTGRGAWRLSGILPITADCVIRPLLGISRTDVMCYLEEAGIEARHDESNDDKRFLRNRIRHQLLPMLTTWNPRIEELLSDTASLELDRSTAFNELIGPLRADLVQQTDEAAIIRLAPETSPHILRCLALEQIRRLDPAAREVDSKTLSLITQARTSLSRTLSPRLQARCEENSLLIELTDEESDSVVISHSIRPGDTVIVTEASISMSLLEAPATDSLVSSDRLRQVIQLPPGVPAEFEIRNRKPGDRFRPLGMDQDKNLADFLIDRRIPKEERNSLPLLVWKHSIVWVPGVEVSEEFKVRPELGTRLEVVVERIGGER